MLDFGLDGSLVFEYGNNIRQRAEEAGLQKAFAFPGFVEAFVRPLFCRGRGPFRWVALSGDPVDIERTDRKELTNVYAMQRWMHDLGGLVNAWAMPDDGNCEAGSCLYESSLPPS